MGTRGTAKKTAQLHIKARVERNAKHGQQRTIQKEIAVLVEIHNQRVRGEFEW